MQNSANILLKYEKHGDFFFFAWNCKKNMKPTLKDSQFINWGHVITLRENSKGMVCLESFGLLVSYFGSD